MRTLQPSAGCRRPLCGRSSRLLGLSFNCGRHGVITPRPRPPLLLQSLGHRSSRRRLLLGSGAIVAAGSSQPTSLFEVTHRAAGYNEAGVAKLATTRRATGLGSSTNIYTRGHRVRRASSFQFRRGGAPSPGPSRRPGGRRCVLLSLLRELFPNPPFGVAAVVRAPRYRHGLLAVASSNGVGWSLLPGCSCAFGTRRSLFIEVG